MKADTSRKSPHFDTHRRPIMPFGGEEPDHNNERLAESDSFGGRWLSRRAYDSRPEVYEFETRLPGRSVDIRDWNTLIMSMIEFLSLVKSGSLEEDCRLRRCPRHLTKVQNLSPNLSSPKYLLCSLRTEC
ncbi:hypothetical protein AVEN_234358-1 [Araneus ventricosus]|uniref:Uncharacterized protein n=1 Tax=Araneus ventricosus TaxID=182803 RepID=A0A4Y2A9H8_ARAVE|nr:hypothetical protein AVEN_234358-1 [Araneus ventricosus]